MATEILAQPSIATDARFEAHRAVYIDEFTALAQEIQEAEGYGWPLCQDHKTRKKHRVRKKRRVVHAK